MKIDRGKLLRAMVREGLGLTGFLQRISGEIVLIGGQYGDANEMAIDAVFDDAAVSANPHDWIEIPRRGTCFHECSTIDEFADEFLRSIGIWREGL